MNALKAWFAPVLGSVKGTVNAEELARVLLAALYALLVSGAGTLLAAVLADAPAIFRGPALPIAVYLITGALEYVRRLNHGTPT